MLGLSGAGPLVARGLGKVAYQRHAGARRQGQQIALVLEQDAALRGGLARQGVVLRLAVGVGRGLYRGRAGEDELQCLVRAGVERVLGDASLPHRGGQLADRAQARRGHLKGGARRHPGHVVVGAAPVGDHGALVPPLVAQDVLEQVGVLVCVGAVHEVVGGHDGLGGGLAHAGLEAGEVDLAQGALVEHGVGRLAARLLAVDGKVLGAGADAHGLDAAHGRRRHLSAEVGVLGVVLEVPAAQGVALDAQPGGKQHTHALAGGLFAHGGAHALDHGGVPGVGERHGGGEAGRGLGGVEAQVVRGPGLVPDSGGAVRERDLGDAQALYRPGLELAGSLQERALLLERELGDDVGVLHASSSTRFPL